MSVIVVEGRNITRDYHIGGTVFNAARVVHAVKGVRFAVERGKTLAIVGESGCGKSTTARLLLRLLTPDKGTLRFDGVDLGKARGRTLRALRAQLQVVPQHPLTSLNPRMTIGGSIEFNMRAHGVGRGDRQARVRELLARVGLPPAHADRFPHQLSGGQLQRVAIARALACEPKLLVLDEPTASLDVSVQAQVLNLLTELQRELGMAYVFISHDLSVVEHISDRVAVMYLGRVVEEATAAALYTNPMHPYSRALLSAVPGRGRTRIMLQGDPPSAVHIPSGCRFRTRCPDAVEACTTFDPPLVPARDAVTHHVACVHVKPALPGEALALA
jgi:oligopeptide/dipeptide ABC transporter ATP-binding protein